MTSQTRTRLASGDVSDDSALESDVSSLVDGDTGFDGAEDGCSPSRRGSTGARRDVARTARPRANSRMASFRAVTSSSRNGRCAPKRDRMLLREWLQTQADRRSIPNMQWCSRERNLMKIPWKHGSRSGWTIDDCQLYRAWAQYTGT